MSWKDKVIELKQSGSTWLEVAEAIKMDFPELTSQQRYDKARNLFRFNKGVRTMTNQGDIKSSPSKNEFNIIETLKKGISIFELAEKLNISAHTCEGIIDDIKSQGYNVLSIGDEVKISNIIVPVDNRTSKPWDGEKIIRFALMGDTQINSKYTQLTHLHKFYDI
ncbi:MAG TPA: winged helix-turn-helix domain-containing protein, partial [Clostridiales bacterium]|nr:winged helix-turn-helix domain-containing protein [Clostridiales bacterium]